MGSGLRRCQLSAVSRQLSVVDQMEVSNDANRMAMLLLTPSFMALHS